MKLKNINIAFVIVAAASFGIFCYLLFLQYGKINSFKELIKTVYTLLFPLPLAIFSRYALASNPQDQNLHELSKSDVVKAILMLLVAAIFMALGLVMYSQKNIAIVDQSPLVLHLLNSTLINIYLVNHFTRKNLNITSIVSGLLMGLASTIFLM